MKILANAKLNLTLDVTGKRGDGYHLLDMLTVPLLLADEMEILPSESLTMAVSGDFPVPMGQDNLVWKAACALQKYCKTKKGAKILLEKHIPSGAGLGGGSADAAAALKMLNAMWALNLPDDQLAQIGLGLGADVPLCLLNAPARVGGIGENLEKICLDDPLEMVLVKPCEGLNTREVFGLWDGLPPFHPDTSRALEAFKRGDLAEAATLGGNSLYNPACALRPELSDALDEIRHTGALYAGMTGSGCVVYGIYADAHSAQSACKALKNQPYPWVCQTAFRPNL